MKLMGSKTFLFSVAVESGTGTNPRIVSNQPQYLSKGIRSVSLDFEFDFW